MSASTLSSAAARVRLSKQLSARLRLCSRREADEWIQEGRVFLNGAQAETGAKVAVGDTILIKGIPGEGARTFHVALPSAQLAVPRVFLAHKRSGEICSRAKENNIFENLEAKGLPRGLIMAGGLDVMASGLVVLTDNSNMRNMLEAARLNQVFFVKCASRGPPDQTALRWLKSGPNMGKIRLPSVSATILQTKHLPQEHAYKSEISIAFKGGKFGDVKDALGKIGLAVTDAERRKIGAFELDARLRLGTAAELSTRLVETKLDKMIPEWRDELLEDSSES